MNIAFYFIKVDTPTESLCSSNATHYISLSLEKNKSSNATQLKYSKFIFRTNKSSNATQLK